MSDATDDSTQNPRPITLRISEIHKLANRLQSRGVSKLNTMPELQADMLLAARVIRTLLRSFNAGDVVTVNGD
jgi:hypothetical protein